MPLFNFTTIMHSQPGVLTSLKKSKQNLNHPKQMHSVLCTAGQKGPFFKKGV